MATIKPIEGKSIHQIQSGQVIVDISSVVKELVENGLDAGATSIEVRFRNNGLDAIEVQDNGSGIGPEDFESIALKHRTSKLSTFDDLDRLQTFGFRGEALSSLCALSNLHIITARDIDAPKGTKLDFDVSGKIAGKAMIASQKGTTATVEDIFKNLPVRRKELEKNIKREYGKVLSLLHSYACISTGVRFSVSNQAVKGKRVVAFSTNGNATTRENISNVYGAKTLLALLPFDLKLALQPTATGPLSARARITEAEADSRDVTVTGHISRPVVGEGRQAPDRQMFFVNSRPCSLPQVAKAINEVYKSYNVTQSPFIFANLQMDTNSYDVNVSPDKRTVLLHDQAALLESLKSSLIDLFETHDASVPQVKLGHNAVPAYRPLTISKFGAKESGRKDESQPLNEQSNETDEDSKSEGAGEAVHDSGLQRFPKRNTIDRATIGKETPHSRRPVVERKDITSVQDFERRIDINTRSPVRLQTMHDVDPESRPLPRAVQDFNDRMADQAQDRFEASDDMSGGQSAITSEIPSASPRPPKSTPGVVQAAFDRMRPRRTPGETATVTIGDKTTVMVISRPETKRRRMHTPKMGLDDPKSSHSGPTFAKNLRPFSAPGTQLAKNAEEAVLSRDGYDEMDQSSSHMEDLTSSADDSEMSLDDPEPETSRDQPPEAIADDDSDVEYIDEDEKRAREETKIAEMIAKAEEAAARPSEDNIKRAESALKGRTRKDSTLQLVQYLEISVASIERKLAELNKALLDCVEFRGAPAKEADVQANDSIEERLSLTVSKADFARMRIVGQFNLGFILAKRPAMVSRDRVVSSRDISRASDELFIIDQHASDEKYNFERLQAETVVQNQRLVHPRRLELTAVEEEIILNYPDALVKNGFLVSTDESGATPVGQRCKLTSIPMSREVVFNHRDLEELLALLSEYSGGTDIPRPSKVRRMFAMRACRSSIMIGKSLSQSKMEKVVRNLGGLDKPWNCPHGRPTMRHLFGFGEWTGWSEGDGLMGMGEHREPAHWKAFAATGRAAESAASDNMVDDSRGQ